MINNSDKIEQLMLQHGCPFYLYDESIISKQIDLLKKKLSNFEFFYSIKANPFRPIVNFITSRGLGVDAASAEEVMLAYGLGLPSEKVIFSSPGKTHDDLEKTFDKSIIIADSYNELALIDSIAKRKTLNLKVGLRINPDFTMDLEKGDSSKFGVDEETLIAHRDFFNSLNNITIAGIQVHVRSQVLDYNKLYRYYEKIFKLAVFCKEIMGWEIEIVDFGGGLGIAYSLLNDNPLNLDLLSTKCKELFQKFRSMSDTRFIAETGRFVVCEAGQYITRIVDIKDSRGIKYLIVQNGLNGFMRPSIAELLMAHIPQASKIQASEPLFTVKDAFEFNLLKKESPLEKVSIVGNLCTNADILARDVVLPKPKIGDILVISKAGSYAYTLTPLLFASHPFPQQFYLNSNGEIV